MGSILVSLLFSKPQIAWEQQAILAPQIQKLFNTNHSYCDVHTAISPISRVDFDHRVPDAAMMKGVYNRYGMLLMNERKGLQWSGLFRRRSSLVVCWFVGW